MEKTQLTFEERKAIALRAARAEGIVDVVQGANDGISLDTLEVATKLTEKHAPDLYKKLEERRKSQR